MAIESDSLISSFITDQGIPATGLTPTINIWEVTPVGNLKVVSDDNMSEVAEGWYKYNFTTYDTDKHYLIKVDGGATLYDSDRYQAFGNENFKEDIADAVWNESNTDHLIAGSTGYNLATIKSDATALRLDVTNIVALAETLLKYEANRTKVDKVAKTLTVYDNDGTTPLKVFDLLDGTSTPSVDEIAERVPQ